MCSPGSVTAWISQLKAGEAAAAQPLWERHFRRLVALARRKLQATPCRAADEEDVALSAFDSFFRAAHRGQRNGPAGRGGRRAGFRPVLESGAHARVRRPVSEECRLLLDRLEAPRVAFSPDGGRLYSANRDGTVMVWDGRPVDP
jgi:hypothetical protein